MLHNDQFHIKSRSWVFQIDIWKSGFCTEQFVKHWIEEYRSSAKMFVTWVRQNVDLNWLRVGHVLYAGQASKAS